MDKPIIAREFIPNEKKPFLTLSRIHFFSILLLFPLIYLHSRAAESNYPLALFVDIAFGLSLITIVVTKIIAACTFEPLNGKLAGKLIFNKNGIELNKKFYNFNEIQDISISLNHYQKEQASGIGITYAHPVYSNGVDNKLTFRLAGLYTYSYFQINSKENMLDFIDYLKSVSDTVKINVTYKDRSIKVLDFNPKLYGLL